MSIATLGQGARVVELIIQKQIASEKMQELLSSGLLADLLDANVGLVNREEFRKLLGLGTLMPDITELTGVVLPELSATFGDRIAAGSYNWKNDNITQERFPMTLSAGPRALVLAHFNKVRTGLQVEEWAAENDYEVALIDDLLAVGAHPEYRELQRQFPIVALGSSAVVGGGRCVPFLRRLGAERRLSLDWCGGDWDASARFLLVRKSKPLVA